MSLKSAPGVVILPMLPDGRVALIKNYRHATRSWEYELPRGAVSNNETIEIAALRELKEETGLIADKLIFLGKMNVDSGLTNTVASVFLAKVVSQESSEPEDSEAIASIETFFIEEIKEGFISGFLYEKGTGERVNLRDSFLSFALFQVSLRNSF